MRPLIGVTAGAAGADVELSVSAVERASGEAWVLTPDSCPAPAEVVGRVGALVLTDGPDLNPSRHGERPDAEATRAEYDDARDAMELALVRAALGADLPLYGIGRGMRALNAALGGGAPRRVEGHAAAESAADSEIGEPAAAFHHVYISPGSKLAAVVGSGGFVRVNSLHRRGVREAQKSPLLLASAYSLEDGTIEALESPTHRWVIAVQFRPDRRLEIPPHFDRLIQSLVERAAERLS